MLLVCSKRCQSILQCSLNQYSVSKLTKWQVPKNKQCNVIVSPDESWGYSRFSTVTPLLPQRFPFGRNNLKIILDLSNLVCGYIWAMPQTLLFVTLTFNFKVTGGVLKVRFWPVFHILAKFSYTERSSHGWYI